eukprot:CAMPEP_0168333374 /NCGR_PEP_ID=MMETSP0213-20121227/9574_1 /TAXON_ID=151035 /ORGANISM="Euplotes harpa, Strain FSP1.4" /LENGTH=188 /DNA_ID=CAMNT_0008337695 /DNA_START=668 /DNA_END=1234 /DNA_ORIENTATION=+
MRNYSARNRSIDAARLGSRLASRDQSLSALKEYQKTPASSRNHVRINNVGKKDYASLLPPRSNRPANYRKNSDRVACPLPPIARPAGLPSLGPNPYRLRSESSKHEPAAVDLRHVEVTQLDVVVVCQKHVGALEVAVHDAHAVEVLDAAGHLSKVPPDCGLGDVGASFLGSVDEALQVTGFGILHDDT